VFKSLLLFELMTNSSLPGLRIESYSATELAEVPLLLLLHI